jgi:glutamate/tyrosine decarboxylase-like PLP-dependent enzyme
MANLLGVLIARTRALGVEVRRNGVGSAGKRLVAYTSAAAHGCISQAMDLSGLGSAALHVIPINDLHQIDIDALDAGDRAGSQCGPDAASGGWNRGYGRYRRRR